MIAPIHSLGPGERVGLWVQGCSKNCFGCISKELQLFDSKKDIPVELITNMIIKESSRTNCRRLTISGGDPFEQAEELFVLLSKLRDYFVDILVYTGYTIEEINMSDTMHRCLEYIDVLIDGRYIESDNTGSSRLCGSNNQKIIFLNSQLKNEYIEYDKTENLLESFLHNDKVITIGIQRR